MCWNSWGHKESDTTEHTIFSWILILLLHLELPTLFSYFIKLLLHTALISARSDFAAPSSCFINIDRKKIYFTSLLFLTE